MKKLIFILTLVVMTTNASEKDVSKIEILNAEQVKQWKDQTRIAAYLGYDSSVQEGLDMIAKISNRKVIEIVNDDDDSECTFLWHAASGAYKAKNNTYEGAEKQLNGCKKCIQLLINNLAVTSLVIRHSPEFADVLPSVASSFNKENEHKEKTK